MQQFLTYIFTGISSVILVTVGRSDRCLPMSDVTCMVLEIRERVLHTNLCLGSHFNLAFIKLLYKKGYIRGVSGIFSIL